MLPTLKDGDVVLIKPGRDFTVGDIVLANHPYKNTKIIKRVSSISAEEIITLSGDNPQESTDSRVLGEITQSEVVGKVVSFRTNCSV